MNPLKKSGAILSLLLLCAVILVALVRPARGDESAPIEDLPLKSYLPVMGHNTNALPPLFGVQTYGSTMPGAVYTPFLLETNAHWVRAAIYWDNAEPVNTDPASYDWSAIDSTLAVSAQGSLRFIATVERAPEWAADSWGSPIYPDKFPEFAQFMGAVVERYDGDGYQDAPGSPVVTYWEIFNEQDASVTNWRPGWGEYGAQYAQLLRAIYPAVKQANGKAQVVFGGLAYDWWQTAGGPFVERFLDEVLAAGGGAYFDIMNFHSYPAFWPNWTNDSSSGLYEKAQAIRSKLQQYGVEKPVITTEAGWHSSNEVMAPSSPEQQARYVTELFVESMAADLDVMIWWMLFDPPGGYDNGLITVAPDPAIKPSYTAFQTIVSWLGDAEFVRQLATPAPVTDPDGSIHSMDAYEFRDRVNRRTIYVAWMNPVDGNTTWQLRLPVAQATKYNIYNTSNSAVRDADDGVTDGYITVPVSSHPIYVVVPW